MCHIEMMDYSGGKRSTEQIAHVEPYLLSIFQAQLFSQLSTQLHFMAVQAGGGSVLSPAEEHWRSMAPGQLQSLVLYTNTQSTGFAVVLFDCRYPSIY